MFDNLLQSDKSKLLVFFDFETLNLCLNFCNNLPWQLGMVKVKGENIIDSRDIYIKWDTHLKISEDAARITRYSQEKMDEKGVAPETCFQQMHEWLEQAEWIIAHNGYGFDMYLVKEWYKLNQSKYWKEIFKKLIDTNLLAKGIKLNMPFKAGDNLISYQYKMYHHIQKGLKTNLTVLGKEYNIEHDYANLHDAIVDLSLNVKVWNKLKWQVEI